MCPISSPNVRTSGVGLKEYIVSGTSAAACVMYPLTGRKRLRAISTPVDGDADFCAAAFAGVCATAGNAATDKTSKQRVSILSVIGVGGSMI